MEAKFLNSTVITVCNSRNICCCVAHVMTILIVAVHSLECAGLLMRSRTEWLKGLGTEVTGSLGKEEASAGSRQNTVLGCGHGREAAMYGCNLKQEAFLGLGVGRQRIPTSMNNGASLQCRGVRVPLRAVREELLY